VEHDRLVVHDSVQLSALLKQAGYSITLQPGRKLYLAGDNEPWLYAGVARKGNTTLGFRIQHGDYEFTISNIMPEVVDVVENDPIAELKYLAQRSYKHVKPIKSLKTGLGIKAMIVDELEFE
jgi:hypothetical protein